MAIAQAIRDELGDLARLSRRVHFVPVLASCAASGFLLFLSGCGPCRALSPFPSRIHAAVIHGESEKVERLIAKGVDVDLPDYMGRTPLYMAALYGETGIATFLLDNGADIYKSSRWKEASLPLLVAAKNGHLDVVRLLLSRGADVEQTNVSGRTALHYACWARCVDTVKYLLENGAAPNMKDKLGNSPLHSEYVWEKDANRGYRAVSELLIQHGADVNVTNTHGKTPLHDACIAGNQNVVRLLLDHGADPRPRTKGYLSPLEIAGKRGHMLVIRELESAIDRGSAPATDGE